MVCVSGIGFYRKQDRSDIGMANNAERIERDYTYHPPKPGQPEQYAAIRSKAKELALLIDELVPPSREQSVALTHLESAVMFANAGIARHRCS